MGGAVLAVLLTVTTLSLIRPDIPLAHLILEYTDEHSQFIELDGVRVHVRDQGQAVQPALLLLHGTFASLHTWDGWADALQDDYRLVRLDLPGFGLTGPHPDQDYSLAATLYLLEQLRTHLAIEQWAVVGNSLGAGYALAYAQHFPEVVTAVGALNGGRIRLSAAEWAARQAEVSASQQAERGESLVVKALGQPQLRALLTRLTPRFVVRYALRDVFGEPTQVDAETVRRYQDLLRRSGNRQAFVSRSTASTRPVGAVPPLGDPIPAAELEMPVIIVWGERDRWIPLAVGERLHQALPDSVWITYAELGHVPMEESPEQTARDVVEVLARSLREL
jgi:pimeloyl-ACP methyl ester carboxylesterase